MLSSLQALFYTSRRGPARMAASRLPTGASPYAVVRTRALRPTAPTISSIRAALISCPCVAPAALVMLSFINTPVNKTRRHTSCPYGNKKKLTAQVVAPRAQQFTRHVRPHLNPRRLDVGQTRGAQREPPDGVREDTLAKRRPPPRRACKTQSSYGQTVREQIKTHLCGTPALRSERRAAGQTP